MLKSIEIQNFRSCRSTKLRFKKSVCALVGKNGVGKTNILRGIEWLAGSAHLSGPIIVETTAEMDPDDPGFAVSAVVNLEGTEFSYTFEAPPFQDYLDKHNRQFVVEEKLMERRNRTDRAEVFTRRGEEIKIVGRNTPIRVSPFTFAIGALSSLLPNDDPVRKTLAPLASFLSGITYYSLIDLPDASDVVPERAYYQWARSFPEGPTATESVSLRLIYMMKSNKEMFGEFEELVGPNGLDLVRKTHLVETSAAQFVGKDVPVVAPPHESFLYAAFEPVTHMGGAGTSFRFSQLSDGSRRAIRLVTSLLFDKRSLMLMEQPEDSIHPGLVRKMMDLLRSYSARSQVIFTTQSPDVLDTLEPDEVLLINAPDGHTQARALSRDEIIRAQRFLKDSGSLSEYIELSDD